MAAHPWVNVTIRPASFSDIPEILRQRRRMYEDMNYKDSAALDAMSSLSSNYLEEAIPQGLFHAWLGYVNERPVAGGAVLVTSWPAHPYDLECRRATILNVYTDPLYRRRGIARLLMEAMIDWCKHEGFARVNLHASDSGRHLYESLGFEPGNEMSLKMR